MYNTNNVYLFKIIAQYLETQVSTYRSLFTTRPTVVGSCNNGRIVSRTYPSRNASDMVWIRNCNVWRVQLRRRVASRPRRVRRRLRRRRAFILKYWPACQLSLLQSHAIASSELEI
ncbi:hypothetical protein EVAR_33418_1 [Eumeta japonica]|uniref:Uncharacterized protein n=1 Tax=Eumeta variegata TaxID=151549 RepID=A0A4C1W2B4_EUMVA|nr:hypothetical protein EVAR_33418_1 [Eumeta japonica]